jgi:hypothetical protein
MEKPKIHELLSKFMVIGLGIPTESIGYFVAVWFSISGNKRKNEEGIKWITKLVLDAGLVASIIARL